MAKTIGIIATIIISLLIIIFVIIQPSYTNDQIHSLIDPSQPNFSQHDKLLMILTGIFALIFIIVICIIN